MTGPVGKPDPSAKQRESPLSEEAQRVEYEGRTWTQESPESIPSFYKNDLQRILSDSSLNFKQKVSQAYDKKSIPGVLQLIIYSIASVCGWKPVDYGSELPLPLINELSVGKESEIPAKVQKIFGDVEKELAADLKELKLEGVDRFLQAVAARRKAVSTDLPESCHPEQQRRLEVLEQLEGQALEKLGNLREMPNQELFRLLDRKVDVLSRKVKEEFKRREQKALEKLQAAVSVEASTAQANLPSLRETRNRGSRLLWEKQGVVSRQHGELRDLQRQKSSLSAELDRLKKGRTERLQKDLDEDVEIDQLNQQIEKLSRKRGSTDKIHALNEKMQARVQAIKVRVAKNFDSRIETLQRQIEALPARIDEAEEQLKKAQEERSAAQSSYDRVQAAVEGAERTLSNEPDRLEAEIQSYARAVVFRDGAERGAPVLNYALFPEEAKNAFRAGIEGLPLSLELGSVLKVEQINT
ncbi:MAG: hypothetical protein S4CHLAM2_03480 [Chlamydiales bacterium]|nr:hypothetical protein [Chlamydiales bacterium]